MAFARKLDEYYSGFEYEEHLERLVDEFLTEYHPYDQPERLNPETCKNGMHINTKPENRLEDDSWKCEKCDAVITRCDSLTS